MTWVKLDDSYPDHPKITQVGPLGMALHTAATCYASKYLTDGFVPSAQIQKLINLDGICMMSNGVSNAVTHKQVTDTLTAVGAFEEVPGGFIIHDYLDYNPPAAQVKAERAQNAARQAAWKAAHPKKGKGNGVTNPVNNDTIIPSRTRTRTPINSGTNVPEPSAPPTKPKASKVPVPDGVTFYHDTLGRYPPKPTYGQVEAVMAKARDPDRLQACLAEWVARGYNPGNLAGWLFDWYANGKIPERPHGGNNGNKPGYGLTSITGNDRHSRAPTDAERAEFQRQSREMEERDRRAAAGAG